MGSAEVAHRQKLLSLGQLARGALTGGYLAQRPYVTDGAERLGIRLCSLLAQRAGMACERIFAEWDHQPKRR